MIRFLLIVSLLALPQNGGVTSVDVPREQVLEKSRPYIGTWDFVACQSSPLGVRFLITPGNRENPYPKVGLIQIYDPVSQEKLFDYTSSPVPFSVDAFLIIKGRTLLDVTNGSLLVTFVLRGGPDTLFGNVLDRRYDDFIMFGARTSGTLEDFYNKYFSYCLDDKMIEEFFAKPPIYKRSNKIEWANLK